MGLLSVGGLIMGIIAIVFGIVILVWPKILAYLIAIYLIIVGVIAIVGSI
jgi:uncharacterized membrane protein HdeD (DUF308 family)